MHSDFLIGFYHALHERCYIQTCLRELFGNHQFKNVDQTFPHGQIWSTLLEFFVEAYYPVY